MNPHSNMGRVLSSLEQGAYERTAIARLTGLTAQQVDSAIFNLLTRKLIRAERHRSSGSRGGRLPTLHVPVSAPPPPVLPDAGHAWSGAASVFQPKL